MKRMNKDFDYSVKLKASDTGSAVLIKQDGAYYLLTAAHVCEGQVEGDAVKITSIDGKECVYGGLERVLLPSKGGADVCVMKLPEDVAITIAIVKGMDKDTVNTLNPIGNTKYHEALRKIQRAA